MTDEEQQPGTVDEFLGTTPRPRWRRWAKYWVPAVVVLIILLLVLRGLGGGDKTQYITEDVARRSLDLTVTATGNLRPTNQVEVGSEVSGRIDDVYVDVNDRVTRGQLLARINTDVINDQITQARASLESARASVEQAKATLEVDRAQLARLQDVLKLSGGKVPSKTELQAAEGLVMRDKAALASARASVASAQAQLSSSETNRDRAAIRSPVSGVVLARQIEPGQTVVASFNTPTLFVLAEDLSTMQLRVKIDEADVGQVKEGQEATFVVDAYPSRRFPAEVTRIDLASSNTATSATSGTGTAATTDSVVNYEARLAVNNADGLLRPGMTATATIATEQTGPQLLVPNGALRFNPDEAKESEGGGMLNPEIGLGKEDQQATIGVGSRQSVHVLTAQGKLEAIPVVTGESDGRYTVVTSDRLKPGMKVVTGVRAKAK
ncbi:secretion protein HlyD [Altererythrobacter sp. B11]|uniref:efflux RND transporter periplasmic adaptor subunit n=1 Tax=Altererythrobacter sp. B11 TaxID=2060312 RepID=UPI000DC72833|nr:efflux RND transporter periplasmic adaptor subunit [Altererythrobacter sp. B11]BBC72194.1 secretion protein HlyD [Altererythrobacter sp. B11]